MTKKKKQYCYYNIEKVNNLITKIIFILDAPIIFSSIVLTTLLGEGEGKGCTTMHKKQG